MSKLPWLSGQECVAILLRFRFHSNAAILASFNCLTDTHNHTYNTARYALHLA